MNLFKKNPIRFEGQKEIETQIKNQTDNVISRRFKILMGVIGVVGVVLLIRLFITQISQQEYYSTKLKQYNTSLFTADTFRGNIYDRNYKRLSYNKNINCATYYAVQSITQDDIKIIANFLVKNVNVDIKSVTERDKKDYLILKCKDTKDNLINDLITSEERSTYSSDEIYQLQLSRITSQMLKDNLSDDDMKYYMIYSKIQNCTSGSVVLLEGLTVKEASLIGENSDILRGVKVTNDWSRENTYGTEFKSVLGRVTSKKEGLPASTKDILLAQDYNNDSRVGISGLEMQYENILAGTPATYSLAYDSDGNPVVETVSSGTKGDNIRLTIDWDLQSAITDEIEKQMKAHTSSIYRYANNIYLVMIDPNTGAIYAMCGYQRDEKGDIYELAGGAVQNAFEIGSAAKGGTIYVGIKHGVINQYTEFDDTSSGFKIAGTPTKFSWDTGGLGRLNAAEALSQSSNIYMFYVATLLGGGTYEYNQPLYIKDSAFDQMRLDVGELGLGVKTGVDLPSEALGYRGRVTQRQAGNFLDFAIGQYDTYTPIQMAQYVSSIANGGKRIQPHLFMESFTEDDDSTKISLLQHQVKVLDDVSSYKLAFDTIHTGFIMGCVSGLASGVNGDYEAAGKTGTGQLYREGTSDVWANRSFIGYAPYDNPEIAVACIAEGLPDAGGGTCTTLSKYAFEKYFEKYG